MWIRENMFQCVFFIGAYAWLPPYMTPYLVKHYCLETGGCINLGNRFLKSTQPICCCWNQKDPKTSSELLWPQFINRKTEYLLLSGTKPVSALRTQNWRQCRMQTVPIHMSPERVRTRGKLVFPKGCFSSMLKRYQKYSRLLPLQEAPPHPAVQKPQ